MENHASMSHPLHDEGGSIVRFLEDQLCHLRSRTRSTAGAKQPIRLVPPEILLRIFFLVLPDDKMYWKGKSSIREDHARSVSQVCRLWRRICLKSSLFWSQALDWNNYHSMWFKKVIKRTRGQSLDVVLDFYASKLIDWNRSWILVERNIAAICYRDKFRSFEFHARASSFDAVARTMNRLKSDYLSSLEKVNICIHRQSRWEFYDPNDDLVDMTLFTDSETMANQLRVLKLTRISSTFSFQYHNLQILSVIDLINNRPHVIRWLRILSFMPNLADLTIKGSISDDWAAGGPPMDISLPNLTTLSLAGSLGKEFGVEAFLFHLIPRNGCNIYFSGRLRKLKPEGDSLFLSRLTDGFTVWFGRWTSADYRSTSLHTCLDANRFIIHNQFGEKPWPGSYFRISVGWQTPYIKVSPPWRLSLISTFSKALLSILHEPVEKAQKITLWSCGQDTVVPWDEFLSQLTSVKTLQLSVRKTYRTKWRKKSKLYGADMVQSILLQLLRAPVSRDNQDMGTLMPSLQEIIISEQGKIKPLSIDYLHFIRRFRREKMYLQNVK
ncbi:hypothetical protein GALMADRAFT_231244 [Galerina marginata CBS 339.88]|uniref:Uncharacterized protein n=1 Tax=Galerina marginata (strain CBS 339.88) TaxID=685588 RepID=A0A067SCH8_GALM3|nr:hypothetical protein GALMADRAFT_231244 [Galerina marginata CBS 339.88]